MLLAVVFVACRNVSLANYDLDPAQSVSSRPLTSDAMMHMTASALTLITDKAMFQLHDTGLRGGLSRNSRR